MKFTFETFEVLFDRFMFHEPIAQDLSQIASSVFRFSVLKERFGG